MSVEQSDDLGQLLSILDLERRGDDLFIGRNPPRVSTPRTFGGQMLSQSAVAAARSLTRGAPPVHALHAHFIRGGDVHKPIEYHVQRFRDGKSFANRQVTAVQDDEELFTVLVAFQDTLAGLEHAVDIPQAPHPDELPTMGEQFAGYEDKITTFVDALHPIDVRFANDPSWKLHTAGRSLDHNRVWMRTDGPLPDDPVLHVAAMCYASDTTVLDSIITTHGLSWGFDRLFAATVNHSMWFHRAFRFDDWLLYATESPVAAGGRGLGSGRFWTREGALVASVTQEALVRHFPRKS
ncbi:acyl-CoA thioesterase II [Gordonia pseudamarae]|jgi:acyl-CoA thioesterase-2|uniref:Acyl-CoA thioesterase II n=1 Tax=Gordonia pseudamarae TaxID=2831662 RepID=A0ABX6IJY8_9ACTN|nr:MULTISPECIES: acyl-CoA thioesterase II [Gordonia]MBD0022966.1 acyl-CoA thioesterase II [Gordonia sp. (in: high G+C Gram-positive bacteria)]QHN26737.1 acyl-CoA thioesterase II [Gordonia pseudamarae]QHN35630.1 acyl-CoA thioesterase II [Gordonia pseudamarae]